MTMDKEKKITEIREALEKATQGPWKWIDPGGLERKKLVGEWEIMNFGIGGVYDQVAGSEPDEDDAHLIANAPEWLGFLLSELDKRDECTKENPCRECLKMSVDGYKEIVRELEDENRKLLEERDEARSKAEEAWKEIDSLERLREERDKLIEVLRWYANPKHWYGDETFCPPEGISTEEDLGQRARDILKEIGVTVEWQKSANDMRTTR